MAQTSNQRQVNFRAIFRKYDKDTDGFISVKDLINVFKELGEEINDEELKEYLRNTGLNQRPNTMVSFENFQRLSKQILRETNRERRLKRVFQEFDVEKKGYIEAQGIKRVLRRLNIDHTESDIDLMIKMADTKGDERVDYDEFIQIFTESDFI
ncbi:hypothetical protein ACROYT_G029626 [Oculina patagonica]